MIGSADADPYGNDFLAKQLLVEKRKIHTPRISQSFSRNERLDSVESSKKR